MALSIDVIVGGTRGIGFACSTALAAAGSRVFLGGRTDASVARAIASLRRRGLKVSGFPVEVTDEDSVQEFVRRAAPKGTRISRLVHAAGAAKLGSLRSATAADLSEMLEVNCVGAFRTLRCALPRMRRGGTVVILGSRAGRRPYANAVAYGASKAALTYIVRAIADDVRRRGVRLHLVSPGAVATELRATLFPREDRSQLLDPEEVAQAVLALTGPAFRSATGAVLDLPW